MTLSADERALLSVDEIAQQLYKGTALAPMVRASTIPLRTLALQYGADFVYTEELVDRSLSDTTRVINDELGTVDYIKDTSRLSDRVKRRLLRDGGAALMLRIDPNVERGKLICQLGTGEANLALEAAMHVYRDVDALDVNMGCPKKFSVSGGMGSALLSDPEGASDIIRTLVTKLDAKKPISAKIRLLKTVSATLDFCEALIGRGGVHAIAIHGRQVGDEAMVPAQWETMKEVISLLRAKHATLPILINGDFYTRQDWMQYQAESGASGVLLARPALYNTSLFRKPTTEPLSPLSLYGYDSPLLLDKTTVIQDYLRQCVRYHTHYKNVKYVICEMMNNRRAPIPRVPFLPQEYEGNQTIATVCSCRSMEELCQVWKLDDKGGGTATIGKQAMMPGEHQYKDSYFLDNVQQAAEDFPMVKRPRLEAPTTNC